tara:strand:+ start:122 stop:577 length:456 start_codon:yes stop_codon:yes gene_type:complete
MKLLTTIAFLLLTFSAFSQEKLSINDGLIWRKGEVLTLEEFKLLLKGAEITSFNVSRAQKQRWRAQSPEATFVRNLGLFAAAVVTIPTGFALTSYAIFWTGNGGHALLGLTGMVSGVTAAYKITDTHGLEIRADRNLFKAVMKYNKKIDSY